MRSRTSWRAHAFGAPSVCTNGQVPLTASTSDTLGEDKNSCEENPRNETQYHLLRVRLRLASALEHASLLRGGPASGRIRSVRSRPSSVQNCLTWSGCSVSETCWRASRWRGESSDVLGWVTWDHKMIPTSGLEQVRRVGVRYTDMPGRLARRSSSVVRTSRVVWLRDLGRPLQALCPRPKRSQLLRPDQNGKHCLTCNPGARLVPDVANRHARQYLI